MKRKYNYINALNKVTEEDAKKGKAQLRILSFPVKSKNKIKEDVHKLPPPFPLNGIMEDEFEKEYSRLMSRFVITKLKKMLG